MTSSLNLPGVNVVRKKLRSGAEATYYYWRATGTRLPPPDDPGFAEALERAKRGKTDDGKEGTWGHAVRGYRRSPAYQRMTFQTKKAYDRALERVAKWEPLRLEEIRRAKILEVRDAIALTTPQAANQLIWVLAAVFEYALDREMVEFNPCHRIKKIKGGEWQPWTDDHIKVALKAFPPIYRRAVLLALYTGQREGDCCAMTWDDFDGTGINVVQEKTGAKLWVPCHKTLRKELAAWPRHEGTPTILTTERGKPWITRSFAVMISRHIHRNPLLKGMVFHGLRKTAAVKLAEAGCSEREIMSITGHASAAMVDHYTRGASQKRRAIRAISLLEQGE